MHIKRGLKIVALVLWSHYTCEKSMKNLSMNIQFAKQSATLVDDSLTWLTEMSKLFPISLIPFQMDNDLQGTSNLLLLSKRWLGCYQYLEEVQIMRKGVASNMEPMTKDKRNRKIHVQPIQREKRGQSKRKLIKHVFSCHSILSKKLAMPLANLLMCTLSTLMFLFSSTISI